MNNFWYKETVETFDIIPKEDLYRMIENLVISKKFIITISSDINDDDATSKVRFKF